MDYEYVYNNNVTQSSTNNTIQIPIYQQENQNNVMYSNYVDMDPNITHNLNNPDLKYYYDPQSNSLSDLPPSINRIYTGSQLEFLLNKYNLPPEQINRLYQELGIKSITPPKEEGKEKEEDQQHKKYEKILGEKEEKIQNYYQKINDIQLELNINKAIIKELEIELERKSKARTEKIVLNILPIVFSLIIVAMSYYIKKPRTSKYIFGIGLLCIFIFLIIILLSQLNIIQV